jgi:hypothetical protein
MNIFYDLKNNDIEIHKHINDNSKARYIKLLARTSLGGIVILVEIGVINLVQNLLKLQLFKLQNSLEIVFYFGLLSIFPIYLNYSIFNHNKYDIYYFIEFNKFSKYQKIIFAIVYFSIVMIACMLVLST